METSGCITLNPDSRVIPWKEIPVLRYEDFFLSVSELLQDPICHCLTYHAAEIDDKLRFFCCIADDSNGSILIFSHVHDYPGKIRIKSLTSLHFSMHVFERELAENFGVEFTGNPWPKPLRKLHGYPFYHMEGKELHEVGVGPVHAGIIEPGHFRFICSGEKALHLEIQLGYQHRGLESLMLKQTTFLQRQILAESIAGDSAIGHGLAHAQLTEYLSGLDVPESLQAERIIAMELERIAMHIGDSAALYNDVAYQLGQVVNEALRTTIINSTQLWCGNRFGKGLIRAGGTRYPLISETMDQIAHTLRDTGKRFQDISYQALNLPSVLLRFDGIGKISRSQAESIGMTGMAARASGLSRDIRVSHPFQKYRRLTCEPVILETGDILARAQLRSMETEASVNLILGLFEALKNPEHHQSPIHLMPDQALVKNSFAISMTEGWRGEIVHCALTDADGEILHYKIKDPSLHNWMGLALSIRDQEISDFPVINKSFNLSYCGNDL